MPIRVVNVIPQTLSGETNFDSEPNIAVNPADLSQIVLSAFTPDPTRPSTTGPYFFSTDGGQTWALNSVIPGGTSFTNTNDCTIRFGGTSGLLYASILRADNGNLNILRKPNVAGPGVMTILVNRSGPDQPWVETSWAGLPGGAVAERVYVSSNVSRATIEFSLSAASAPPPAGFVAPFIVDPRSGSNRPSVRTTTHKSGRIYGIFVGVRTGGSDIVVIRDDNWGSGNFNNLVDPGDSISGRRVVTGVTVPPVGTMLGTQRISSRLSIAADPRNSRRVYIVWGDGSATPASPFTLRVRRSDDGGLNWTRDLFTVANATNPGLAVNNQGVVALLYQQLVNISGTNRWRTHIARSTDQFVAVATDNIVGDVLDSNVGASTSVVIGDYANLISVGKDFYATFSGHNLPVTANFPASITYLRNANFVTQQLLDVDNVTPVSPSVDPFFVHYQTVELKDDFYVRDWTDSSTIADDGAEPSIRPYFYVRPDVWNRRGTSPGSFTNDQPDNKDAGNGLGNIGDNWLFARIRRRAAPPAGSADVNVTAHFLISKLGTGSNYVDASVVDPDVTITTPDPIVTFSAAETGPKVTAPLYWHLNPVSSTHLCAAVEISTPSDPYVGTSLRGRAPGWPDQDLEIMDDNNKAQRNLGLSTTPAKGVECPATLYGIIHNAATQPRNIVLQYTLSPSEQKRNSRIQIEVVGQKAIVAKNSGTIVLNGMQPGENRWVGVHFSPTVGKSSLLVLFDEMIENSVVNGFGLAIHPGSDREVWVHTLNRLLSVFRRLAAVYKLYSIEKHIQIADKALKKLDKTGQLTTARTWLKGLRKDVSVLKDIAGLIKGDDDFNITPQEKKLRAVMAKKGSEVDILVCLTSYLERVDSHLTSKQLIRGDTADILQNVRWQRDILIKIENISSLTMKDIEELCTRFISAWNNLKASFKDYTPLIDRLKPLLRNLAKELRDEELLRRVEELKGSQHDLFNLQRLHREVLLQIQTHVSRLLQ